MKSIHLITKSYEQIFKNYSQDLFRFYHRIFNIQSGNTHLNLLFTIIDKLNRVENNIRSNSNNMPDSIHFRDRKVANNINIIGGQNNLIVRVNMELYQKSVK